MSCALGGASSRRALSDRFITQALSQLTLDTTATSRRAHAPVRTASWTCPSCQGLPINTKRHNSSNSQWKARQTRDHYARDAKVTGFKSRAAFKLLEVRASPPPLNTARRSSTHFTDIDGSWTPNTASSNATRRSSTWASPPGPGRRWRRSAPSPTASSWAST